MGDTKKGKVGSKSIAKRNNYASTPTNSGDLAPKGGIDIGVIPTGQGYVAPKFPTIDETKNYIQPELDSTNLGPSGYNQQGSLNIGTGVGLALTKGIDGKYNTDFWSDKQWQKFGEEGGTIGDNGEVNLGTGSTSPGMSVKDIATGVDAVTGVANALLGYKNYKLAKDTLNFNKAATNRDIANQGLAYNSALDKQTSNASALGGLGLAEAQARLDANKAKYMNTSAIG